MDVRWNTQTRVRDVPNRFAGDFVGNSATIEWSAKRDNFEFVSDPARTSRNEFSLLGRERNGVFFPEAEEDA